MSTLSYTHAREQLKPGDIIGFSGKGAFSSAIKRVQSFQRGPHSDISHVAVVIPMILRMEDLALSDYRVLILESTTLLDSPDVLKRILYKGVQMQFLSDRLAKYQGEVFWYPLTRALPPDHIKVMMDWATKVHSVGTEYDTIQAVGAGIDFWDRFFENPEDLSRLFCSELATKMLQLAQVLSDDINPSEMTPADLLRCPVFESRIRLLSEF